MRNDDGTTSAFFLGLPLALIIFVWIIVAIVAAVVAPDRRGTFFLITLFFLGPLGIAAAAVAQPRTPLSSTALGWRVPTLDRNPATDGDIQRTSAVAFATPQLADKVRVVKPGDEHDGKVGYVEKVKDGWMWVKFNSLGSQYAFRPEDLKLV